MFGHHHQHHHGHGDFGIPAGFGTAPGLIQTFVYPASFGYPAHTETFVIPGGFGVPAGYGGDYDLPF